VKSVFKSVHNHRRYWHFCASHVCSFQYAATRRLQLRTWPILRTGLCPVQLFLVSSLFCRCLFVYLLPNWILRHKIHAQGLRVEMIADRINIVVNWHHGHHYVFIIIVYVIDTTAVRRSLLLLLLLLLVMWRCTSADRSLHNAIFRPPERSQTRNVLGQRDGGTPSILLRIIRAVICSQRSAVEASA